GGFILDREVFKADWLLLLTALIWGSAFVAQRAGMEHVGPFTFNGVRFALGSLILLPLALRSRPLVPGGVQSGSPQAAAAPTSLWGGGLAGVVLFVAAALQQVGLVYTTAGKAGFITGLYVIIVPLMGLMWGFRPGWGGWLGACLAVAGLYLLSVTEDFSLAKGDFLELLGAFFWAGHVLILGWLSPKVRRIRLACTQFAVCSVLSLAAASALETITWAGIRGAAVPILYGGLLSVGVAYTLQVIAQRHAPPVHAAVILSLEAVFAALAGWLILGEVLGLRGVVGCGLMLAGMLAAQLRS
ncbi:MAG: DMT family transporter, partial [Desulfobacteraceae bacterium]